MFSHFSLWVVLPFSSSGAVLPSFGGEWRGEVLFALPFCFLLLSPVGGVVSPPSSPFSVGVVMPSLLLLFWSGAASSHPSCAWWCFFFLRNIFLLNKSILDFCQKKENQNDNVIDVITHVLSFSPLDPTRPPTTPPQATSGVRHRARVSIMPFALGFAKCRSLLGAQWF